MDMLWDRVPKKDERVDFFFLMWKLDFNTLLLLKHDHITSMITTHEELYKCF